MTNIPEAKIGVVAVSRDCFPESLSVSRREALMQAVHTKSVSYTHLDVYKRQPKSFYQVNPLQTEKLYSLALEYAGLTGQEVVWDLYCGIGTISLFLAQAAKHVYCLLYTS